MRFLAGFSWGYSEGRDEEVQMFALEHLMEADWLADLPPVQMDNVH